jgi:hypothetical protein
MGHISMQAKEKLALLDKAKDNRVAQLLQDAKNPYKTGAPGIVDVRVRLTPCSCTPAMQGGLFCSPLVSSARVPVVPRCCRVSEAHERQARGGQCGARWGHLPKPRCHWLYSVTILAS